MTHNMLLVQALMQERQREAEEARRRFAASRSRRHGVRLRRRPRPA